MEFLRCYNKHIWHEERSSRSANCDITLTNIPVFHLQALLRSHLCISMFLNKNLLERIISSPVLITLDRNKIIFFFCMSYNNPWKTRTIWYHKMNASSFPLCKETAGLHFSLREPPLWLLLLPNVDGTISSQCLGEEPGYFEAINCGSISIYGSRLMDFSVGWTNVKRCSPVVCELK